MNVLAEITEHLEQHNVEVKWLSITYRPQHTLAHIEGTLEDCTEALSKIDYYEGWGSQEIYGYIWYTDGTWSERAEYDGSEWWVRKAMPVYTPGELN